MEKYFKVFVTINKGKTEDMLFIGKSRKGVKKAVTNFYQRLNDSHHNIFDLQVDVIRVYLVDGKYLNEKEYKERMKNNEI